MVQLNLINAWLVNLFDKAVLIDVQVKRRDQLFEMIKLLEQPVKVVKQVLVIATEDKLRETLVGSLKADGHGVIAASGGFAAKNLCQSFAPGRAKFPFDLMILAWSVADAEELKLCHWLRQQANTVPLIVLCVGGTETDRLLAFDTGADDCLSEPFSMYELLTRSRLLWQRQPVIVAPDPTMLQFEDVQLYPQEHRVIVRGREVTLSPKGFQLLEQFMRHPRQVLTRQQLFDKVWDSELLESTKTVEVHVRLIREKIEVRPNQPRYLVTVRGVGYRFG